MPGLTSPIGGLRRTFVPNRLLALSRTKMEVGFDQPAGCGRTRTDRNVGSGNGGRCGGADPRVWGGHRLFRLGYRLWGQDRDRREELPDCLERLVPAYAAAA